MNRLYALGARNPTPEDAINAVRAAAFKPEKKDLCALPDETVDVEKACAHLSEAISIPTVSYPEKEKVICCPFPYNNGHVLMFIVL